MCPAEGPFPGSLAHRQSMNCKHQSVADETSKKVSEKWAYSIIWPQGRPCAFLLECGSDSRHHSSQFATTRQVLQTAKQKRTWFSGDHKAATMTPQNHCPLSWCRKDENTSPLHLRYCSFGSVSGSQTPFGTSSAATLTCLGLLSQESPSAGVPSQGQHVPGGALAANPPDHVSDAERVGTGLPS